MANNAVQLFIAVFHDETQAGIALADFQAVDREGSIKLIDAAVIVRRADGKVTVEETADPGARTWSTRGAIAGGLVGLIFPPSILVTATLGAAGGGIWAAIRDKGFPDSELKDVGESLEPGTSAIVAVAEDRVIERLQRGIAGYQRIARHALSAEAATAVVAEAERPPPAGQD